MDRCDQEVFDKGVSLASLEARSREAEAWVQLVATESGQRVDWHYSGGRAHVLVLGDHAKALDVAQKLAPRLAGRVLRWFDGSGDGLYRAGVTPIPDDVIAVDGGAVVRTPAEDPPTP